MPWAQAPYPVTFVVHQVQRHGGTKTKNGCVHPNISLTTVTGRVSMLMFLKYLGLTDLPMNRSGSFMLPVAFPALFSNKEAKVLLGRRQYCRPGWSQLNYWWRLYPSITLLKWNWSHRQNQNQLTLVLFGLPSFSTHASLQNLHWKVVLAVNLFVVSW